MEALHPLTAERFDLAGIEAERRAKRPTSTPERIAFDMNILIGLLARELGKEDDDD